MTTTFDATVYTLQSQPRAMFISSCLEIINRNALYYIYIGFKFEGQHFVLKYL